MRFLSVNSITTIAGMALLAMIGLVAMLSADDQRDIIGRNLVVNPGFEENNGIGTIPRGWQVVDENVDYFGWIAPRSERLVGTLGPRTGRYMAGLDLDLLGVDTNDKAYHIARSALLQTLEVPGRLSGTFSLYYNDLESSALSHTAAIRMAYTINSTEISEIRFPSTFSPEPTRENARAGMWSMPFFRVSQRLPLTQTAVGDWSLASIPVIVESDEPAVSLTLWIGVFDHQNSTEVAYYRIDDVSFVIESLP